MGHPDCAGLRTRFPLRAVGRGFYAFGGAGAGGTAGTVGSGGGAGGSVPVTKKCGGKRMDFPETPILDIGDVRVNPSLLSDEMLDAFALCGPAGEVRAGIERLRETGVTTLCLFPIPPGEFYPLFPGHFPASLPIESLSKPKLFRQRHRVAKRFNGRCAGRIGERSGGNAHAGQQAAL